MTKIGSALTGRHPALFETNAPIGVDNTGRLMFELPELDVTLRWLRRLRSLGVVSRLDAQILISKITRDGYDTGDRVSLPIVLPLRTLTGVTPGCSRLYVDAPMSQRGAARFADALFGLIDKDQTATDRTPRWWARLTPWRNR